MNRRKQRLVAAAAAGIAMTSTLAACGGDSDATGSDDELLVWSLEVQPDRLAVTKKIAAEFSKKTGTKAKVVAVEETQLPQLIAGAAQAGELPDVVGSLPLAFVRQLDTQNLLDPDAATEVVESLDPETFSDSALELTRDGDQQLSVPSDAWAQILVYRKDLFEAKGLEPPTSFDSIRAAAEELTAGDQYGITLATDPADVFTSQTFETLAVGNGCQLVDEQGEVTLDDETCTETFELYGDLAQNYSPEGKQDVETTRATYFAGKAAMVLWSTFILDELAGLRNDALPTCDQCKEDPAWLAKNSGVVTSIQGPNGSSDGAFGEITSWTVTAGANTDPAKEFVEYMMSDGYMDWVGMAPEGKFPVRMGPEPGSTEYTDGWGDLEAGVDRKEPLSEFYDQQTIDIMSGAPDNISRWAITQGQGALLGPTIAELPIPKAIASLATGSTDAAGAAQESADAVREIQSSLG
ncbi:MAG: ABC transporter substrate-binding protein [Nocardioidaceae bacterium]